MNIDDIKHQMNNEELFRLQKQLLAKQIDNANLERDYWVLKLSLLSDKEQ